MALEGKQPWLWPLNVGNKVTNCYSNCLFNCTSQLVTIWTASGHYIYRQWSLYIPPVVTIVYIPPVVTICTTSGHYMYRTLVTICTASGHYVYHQWSLYIPHSGHYMYRIMYSIDLLVFIIETECVYCAVRSTFYVLPTQCIYVFCVDLTYSTYLLHGAESFLRS